MPGLMLNLAFIFMLALVNILSEIRFLAEK
jgi:hypothetical protein